MNFRDKAAALGFEEGEFREMLQVFVAVTDADIEKLKAAINEGKPQLAVEAAHSIKGAARGFGLDEMSQAAEALEMRARQNDLDRNRNLLADLETQFSEIVVALRGQR